MRLLCRPIDKMLYFSFKILNIFLSSIYSINLMYLYNLLSADLYE